MRMHHPDATGALDVLFAGYGEHPDWSLRHTEMIRHCERLEKRCEAEGLLDAEAMWRACLTATDGWKE